MSTSIARELLEAERDRLARDHYADDRLTSCDGCKRAVAVADELATIGPATIGDVCAACRAPMFAVVRGHSHTEHGRDVTRAAAGLR